jgi:hypothetical protein
MKDRNYHRAAELWLNKHATDTVMCFVQFFKAELADMPRLYLATPAEVADRLKAAAGGRGDTVLNEDHTWSSKAYAAGKTDRIPPRWVFTNERAESLAHSVRALPRTSID